MAKPSKLDYLVFFSSLAGVVLLSSSAIYKQIYNQVQIEKIVSRVLKEKEQEEKSRRKSLSLEEFLPENDLYLTPKTEEFKNSYPTNFPSLPNNQQEYNKENPKKEGPKTQENPSEDPEIDRFC